MRRARFVPGMATPRTDLRTIDFRSDTVTQPTDAMRHAMATAEVGDDVYGEDPTVNRLQEKAAKMIGTEAALFVPTGTMGNQVCVWVHSGRTGSMVCEETCHLALYEGGASSLLSNVTLRTVRNVTGTFSPADIAHHFPPPDPHFSPVKLVAIENTHNYAGGRCWSTMQTKAVTEYAHERGAKLHLDGARIFDAAIAKKTTAAKLAAGADSVMFCLSKGLSAPVGSLVCGSEKFIHEARTARKILGGGMRQAGHLAAAGIVALATGIERLADDHANAKFLAQGLADLPGIKVDLTAVETNMVMADITATKMTAAEFLEAARKVGVLGNFRDGGPTVRFVTHRNVGRADCQEALERLSGFLR